MLRDKMVAMFVINEVSPIWHWLRLKVRPRGVLRDLSALCWACKLVMKKLKRILGPNATEERITTKLKVICNELGLLKSRCHRFVEKHLRVLVKELTTKDDVKTVCIKIRACRYNLILELIIAFKQLWGKSLMIFS
uniref:Saposin B-type domain-containing protein n=1 Tax=Cyprinodon variegatus TaxID=28743 RepID=A0A3Q2EG47_CYPVA